jgi:hypothetical protein
MTKVNEFIAAVEFARMQRPGTHEWHAAHERCNELRGPAYAEALIHDRRARLVRAVAIIAVAVFVSWVVMR